MLVCFGLAACAETNQRAEPHAAPTEPCREVLRDVAAEVGLTFVHENGVTAQRYMPEIMGAGAAVLDVDNDGDLDVFLVQSGQVPGGVGSAATDHNYGRLFRNQLQEDGRLAFVDVTADAGLDGRAHRGFGMGVAVGDVDRDGFVDLYLTRFGPDRLLRNRGAGAGDRLGFDDITPTSGVGDSRWTVSASFVDYDRDGWLDLYVASYVDFTLGRHLVPCSTSDVAADYCGPHVYGALSDRLFRNLGLDAAGQVRFADVSQASGIAAVAGRGLGVAVADFDGDGWPDIYVANDWMDNFLWRNQGIGADGQVTFRELGLGAGCARNADGVAEGSMGVDAADFDRDGDEDLFLTHLTGEKNTLYVNRGDGNFIDATRASGLAVPSLPFTGFGTAWLDYDNDGWLDLLTVNGAVRAVPERLRQGDEWPYDQQRQLFRNLGRGADGRVTFADVSAASGPAFAGFTVGRGAAFGDVDNDGAVDVVINDSGAPARLLRNLVGSENAWLGVRLRDVRGHFDPAGARVTIVDDTHEVRSFRRSRRDGSYASANDARLVFGLGAAAPAQVDVIVEWPSGSSERFRSITTRRWATLSQGSGVPMRR